MCSRLAGSTTDGDSVYLEQKRSGENGSGPHKCDQGIRVHCTSLYLQQRAMLCNLVSDWWGSPHRGCQCISACPCFELISCLVFLPPTRTLFLLLLFVGTFIDLTTVLLIFLSTRSCRQHSDTYKLVLFLKNISVTHQSVSQSVSGSELFQGLDGSSTGIYCVIAWISFFLSSVFMFVYECLWLSVKHDGRSLDGTSCLCVLPIYLHIYWMSQSCPSFSEASSSHIITIKMQLNYYIVENSWGVFSLLTTRCNFLRTNRYIWESGRSI